MLVRAADTHTDLAPSGSGSGSRTRARSLVRPPAVKSSTSPWVASLNPRLGRRNKLPPQRRADSHFAATWTRTEAGTDVKQRKGCERAARRCSARLRPCAPDAERSVLRTVIRGGSEEEVLFSGGWRSAERRRRKRKERQKAGKGNRKIENRRGRRRRRNTSCKILTQTWLRPTKPL